MRFFNTTGPVVPASHYLIPPLARVDLPAIRRLIAQHRYFVLRAPRQTGKTSVLLALRDLLNAEGGHRCVYVNVESAQAAREDMTRVVRTVRSGLAYRARRTLDDHYLHETWPDILAKQGPDSALFEALAHWTEADASPLVLLIDEIDALVGDGLLSVLRQLRAGYDMRPKGFPQSVVLCGVRDVRDYRIHSGSADTMVAGGSVQRQGQVSAAGRLLAGRHVRAAGPAHRRDRPSLCGPSAGDPVAAHPGPAVAGQCSGLRGVLRGRRRGGPVAADRGKTTCWRPRSL